MSPRLPRGLHPIRLGVSETAALTLGSATPFRSFSALPREVQRMMNRGELLPTDGRVWAELDHRARGRGWCLAGAHEVASTLNLADSTVWASFARLSARGLLNRTRQFIRDAAGRWADGKALNVLLGGNRVRERARKKADAANKRTPAPFSDSSEAKTVSGSAVRAEQSIEGPKEGPGAPVEVGKPPVGALANLREKLRADTARFKEPAKPRT